MDRYEQVRHGAPDFPICVHTTYYENGLSLYPHMHKEFEFLIIKEGNGRVYIDGAEHELSCGDGVFISSGALHFGVSEKEEKCVISAVVFAPEMLGRFGNDLVMNMYVTPLLNGQTEFPSVLRADVPWQAEILECCNYIDAEYRANHPCRELRIKETLFRLWGICAAHAQVQSIVPDSGLEKIKKAIEFMQSEYSSPLTLSDIAAHVSMSREHFCRCFSKLMHMPPFEYLNLIRIDSCCCFLRESDLPVGRIAELCGFNSFSYFSKKFREATGKTPAQYRKAEKSRQ